ncbi:MAG: heavy metal translocating P-type ATPase, partial [Deltaproteobacteria bacterium]|nr:heavy metal translocating P-type ATPase [Deltaproteobacteria bacterium]
TPAVIGGAILVALVPPLILGFPFTVWFYRSLVLLVIACPCALVISTPVSIVSGLSAAAQHGILIKGGAYLEEIGSLKAIAFDKTGTITKGIPRLTDVISLNEQPEAKILGLAAAIENRSEHPLGRAIIDEAARRKVSYVNSTDFQSLPGKGAKARFEGQVFYIGNHRLCEELGNCSLEIDARLLDLEREGKTTIILASEDQAMGIIAIADELRQESAPSIQRLKAEGIGKIVMITGDNKGTAGAIARSLGIDEYHAELMPEDKVAIIKDLRERFVKVAMVGDGVNDAPSMAVSSMGIAMGTIGTDTALETADVALMKDDLSKLPFALKLSKRTLRIIKQNIAFSLLLKGAFIALAIPGLATLWMAVGADMGASLLVIFNGLRLLAIGEKGEKNG